MADYPNIVQAFGSVMEVSRGTQADVTESGMVRLRSLYSQDWAVFRILHVCTEAQKNTLLAHFAQHQETSFSFTYHGDGQSYTVRYGEAPQTKTISQALDEWDVANVLVQV